MQIQPAKFGSISHGTLRTEDLLSAFSEELEWRILANGGHFSKPENFAHRDRFNAIMEEANDCFGDDGETILEDKENLAYELVNDTLLNALNEFAPPYSYFGSHCGDGSDFGYWPIEIEDIKEQVGFFSTKETEYPADDYRGEWLHINERGNCTLYVRENADLDREIWSLV